MYVIWENGWCKEHVSNGENEGRYRVVIGDGDGDEGRIIVIECFDRSGRMVGDIKLDGGYRRESGRRHPLGDVKGNPIVHTFFETHPSPLHNELL